MGRRRDDFKHGDLVRVTNGRNEGKQGVVAFVHEVCYDYHKNHYGWEAVIKLPNGKEIEEEVRAIERIDAIERLGKIADTDT